MSAGKARRARTCRKLARSARRARQFRQQLVHRSLRFRPHFPISGAKRRRSCGGRAEFLDELNEYLHDNVDADEIDRTGEIPQKNIDDLFAMGAFGVKIPKRIRRPRFVAGQLRTRRDVARQLGCEPDRARLRASIDRRAATAVAFRDGGAEDKISAARRAPGNLRVRAHRMARRLRSGEHEPASRSDRQTARLSSSTAKNFGARIGSKPACSWSWRRRRRKS